MKLLFRDATGEVYFKLLYVIKSFQKFSKAEGKKHAMHYLMLPAPSTQKLNKVKFVQRILQARHGGPVHRCVSGNTDDPNLDTDNSSSIVAFNERSA